MSFFHVSLLILLLFLSSLLSEEAPLEVIGKPKNDPSLTGSTREDPSGFTEIIKKENFKGRYLSLSEVLEKETGVRIKRYGGLGSYSTLSIRGSNANQVKIYIDGIPLNNSEGGEVNLSDLSFDNLERIEIHKSGMTPGLSSSAIGGSINLITNGKPLKRKTRVSFSGGSFNTFKVTGSHNDFTENLQYGIFVLKEKSDQNFIFHSDNGTPAINTLDDRDVRRKNAQFDRYNVTGNLSFKVRDTKVNLLNDFNYRINGLPGPASNQTEKVKRKYLRNTTGISTSTKGLFFDNLSLDSRLYYTGARDQLFDPRQEFSSGTPNSKADIQQYGIHILPTLYLLNYNQILRFLIANNRESFIRDRRNSLDQVQDKSTKKFRNHNVLQIQDEIRIYKSIFKLLPSIQKEIYTDRFNTIPDISTLSNSIFNDYRLPPTKNVTEFNSYRLGFLWILNQNNEQSLSFKSNISKEFRMPVFSEIFGERGTVIGNTSLKPEKSRNVDAGLVHDYKNNRVSSHLNASVFQKRIEDMILFVPNSQFTLRPENVDSALINGFELGWKIILDKKYRLQSNYTYQKAINTSDVSYLNGKYLPLRPLHEWSGLAGVKFFNWEMGGEAIFIGASFRDRTNEYANYQPGRWIYNLFMNYSLLKDEENDKELLIAFDLKNILNYRTFDLVGYPLPGRHAYIHISYVF